MTKKNKGADKSGFRIVVFDGTSSLDEVPEKERDNPEKNNSSSEAKTTTTK